MAHLRVVDHPLLQRDLTILRDRNTPHGTFREVVSRAATILAYEAMRQLPTTAVPVETPLEPTTGVRLATELIVVPIIRAGLGMVDGFVRFVPEARIGHIGMYRDEKTHRPVDYYIKIPGGLEKAHVFVVDPMLATGGSAVEAISLLKERGARTISFVCLIAAPEGVQNMLKHHPDVPILAGSLDRELDDRAFIRPGLGDAGDRIFGTESAEDAA